MKSKVVWKGGMAFTGKADGDYLLPLDAAEAVGGKDLDLNPCNYLQ